MVISSCPSSHRDTHALAEASFYTKSPSLVLSGMSVHMLFAPETSLNGNDLSVPCGWIPNVKLSS